jgi:hypothetical protein
MYEHKTKPLAPRKKFFLRLIKNFLFSIFFVFFFLTIGTLGYHYTAKVPWLDSFHNASMILSGMGPVIEIKTDVGKVFSSFYALFSGIAFVGAMGLMLSPIVHRFFHVLNLEHDN